jgi:hypothetical protein
MTSTRLSVGQLLSEGRRAQARDELLLIGYGPGGLETLRDMWTAIRDERAAGRLAGHETLHIDLQRMIGSVGKEIQAAFDDGQAEYECEAVQERAAYYDKMSRDASLTGQVAASAWSAVKAGRPESPNAVPPRPARVTQDGMYRHPESGVIYKVQFNKGEGDGRRLYAKKLVVVEEPERNEDGTIKRGPDGKATKPAVIKFVYARGAVLRLNASMRMSKEEAKAFGALYGTCVRCGRDLTLEESIDRMMGRKCASKMGW